MGTYYKLVNETRREVIDPSELEGVSYKEGGFINGPQAQLLMVALFDFDWSGDVIRTIGDYEEEYYYSLKKDGYTSLTGALVRRWNRRWRGERAPIQIRENRDSDGLPPTPPRGYDEDG